MIIYKNLTEYNFEYFELHENISLNTVKGSFMFKIIIICILNELIVIGFNCLQLPDDLLKSTDEFLFSDYSLIFANKFL